ncbi:hypothetical protein DSO57_1035466 [Entomophthora muscae]|uniref:Uncharacterized protein n=1 Tax=Entomophthora muscae TaxID=34485 RepID=A0ACC2SNQ4_9FUNG|nr:hypothetical protein DSO57_1035466 [Entomophthora muscae]
MYREESHHPISRSRSRSASPRLSAAKNDHVETHYSASDSRNVHSRFSETYQRKNTSNHYVRQNRSPTDRHNPDQDRRRYPEATNFIRPKDSNFRKNSSSKDFFESRKAQREASKVVFWPDSDQISDTSEESDHKPKRVKKGLGSDSEEDTKRTKSKEKSKTHRRKSETRAMKSNYASSLRLSSMNPYASNVGLNCASPLVVSISEIDSYEELWVERKIEFAEDTIVGPFPAPSLEQKIDTRSYGGALLAGEAEAMAAYVQSGKRIPRRGEIGMRSEEIEFFERQGFVMSGNRHQRMNAVRIRKENQIISAEEKRALLNFAQEERAKRENKIIADLREMVNK